MAAMGRLSGATAIVTGASAGIGEAVARTFAREGAAVAKKAATNALRCLVEPQDSADAILFLASDESRHVTGVNLSVNAGSAMV